MSASNCRLLFFVRYPLAGQTKTRLIPAIGAIAAANLQRQMAEYILQRLQGLPTEPFWQKEGDRNSSWHLQVCFTGSSLAKMRDWLGEDLGYRQQSSGDLGERLWNGFRWGFEEGCDRIIAIGADCPSLTTHHIQQAFEQLLYQDVVLGPARDGGYYLIGLSHPHSRPFCQSFLDRQALFQNIDWSTSRVFQQTRVKACQMGFSVAQLEMLADVDRPQDLAIWEQLQAVTTSNL